MNPIKILTKSESLHPAKAIFVKNRIPLRVVAKFTRRDYFYTSRLLSGTVKPTPQVEEQIWKLARQVEKAGAANA